VTIGQNTNGTPSSAVPSELTAAMRPTNRAVAGFVIAVMLGMAALGLAFALQTVGIRRANDSKHEVPPDKVEASTPPLPAAWLGLGYLPDDVQTVAGIRVDDALRSSAGNALLARLKLSDDKTILGVHPESVDELIIGASLRTLPPRVTAIAHGRVAGSKPSESTLDQRGKTLERLKLWPNGPEGAVWRPERRTMIAALLPEDFDHIPAMPRTAVPLTELMDRLDPNALAWLVAAPDANDAALALVTPFLPPADRDAWTKLRSLAVSLRVDGPRLTLSAHVRGQDQAAGEAIAKAIAAALKGQSVEPTQSVSGEWRITEVAAQSDALLELLKAR
jgi:hypothetical protein